VSLVVRAATDDDLDALVAVQEEGSVAGLADVFPQDEHPFPRAAVRSRWLNELADPATSVYVAVDGRAIVGFAATRDNELLHFGIAVATWGTGVAQRLHDAVLAELVRSAPAGCGHLRLRVFAANGRARRFYEKLGWHDSGQRTRSSFAPNPELIEYRHPVPASGEGAG
jgi:RimJ/RimL family protein N-acetyltransferase